MLCRETKNECADGRSILQAFWKKISINLHDEVSSGDKLPRISRRENNIPNTNFLCSVTASLPAGSVAPVCCTVCCCFKAAWLKVLVKIVYPLRSNIVREWTTMLYWMNWYKTFVSVLACCLCSMFVKYPPNGDNYPASRNPQINLTIENNAILSSKDIHFVKWNGLTSNHSSTYFDMCSSDFMFSIFSN